MSAITFEDVARRPAPGLDTPLQYTFSPDGKLVCYLASEEAGLCRQLFAYDIETGEHFQLVKPPPAVDPESLSLEEQLRRERKRMLDFGVTGYSWGAIGDSFRLLIPLNGNIFVQDGRDGELALVVDAESTGAAGPTLDAQLSPQATAVAFVQESELYVLRLGEDGEGKAAEQVTSGARGTGKTHGLASYIAQEEMERDVGFWWSPDGNYIAFTEVDETAVPSYRIMHQGKDAVCEEEHRYPFAGARNGSTRLGVVSLKEEGFPVRWMSLDGAADGKETEAIGAVGDAAGDGDDDAPHYLARVAWLPDGSLTAQVQNRAQTKLTLLRLDPATGAPTVLLTEETDVWINLHSLMLPLTLAGQPHLLWGSERTGFMHLYLYALPPADSGEGARLLRAVTSGDDGLVESIAAINYATDTLYYTSNAGDALGSHLFSIPLDGSAPATQVTAAGKALHSVVLNDQLTYYVDMKNTLEAPPVVSLHSLVDADKPAVVLHKTSDARYERLRDVLQPPELFTVESDGVLLHGAVFKPDAAVHGDAPYPCIVHVYGGPHVQYVQYNWGRVTASLHLQYFRQQGYAVMRLDNRGSARRGLAFEGAIKNNMGDLEVRDQAAGVRKLVADGIVDGDRVGVFGWSYGGYMSAMLLAKEADLFKAAVSGAPVTHWDGYDTHYTERYMSTPQKNPDGYRVSSVFHHAAGIKGKLLLVHGLIDENVHFRHTARLINHLIEERIAYDLLLFPDERHMPRKLGDRVYMTERMSAFLETHV